MLVLLRSGCVTSVVVSRRPHRPSPVGRVAADARGLFTWRTVDQELFLASLSFDSSVQHAAPVRGGGDARVLVFDAPRSRSSWR